MVSFCNGVFLDKLPEIVQAGRPRTVVWFNCMTWPFEKELVAIRNRWIDLFGFVSRYQREYLQPQLEKYGPVEAFGGYRPFFNPGNRSQSIEFSYQEPNGHFAVGRISRDDANKFSTDMWRMFSKVCSPRPVKVFVLGYGPNAYGRTGPAPPGLDWQTWLPGEIPVRQFYQTVHCILHKTGGSRESYCRIVPEAYAAGTVVIAENDFAFPDLIDNGTTGFICDSSEEMSYRASELAFNEPLRKRRSSSRHTRN